MAFVALALDFWHILVTEVVNVGSTDEGAAFIVPRQLETCGDHCAGVPCERKGRLEDFGRGAHTGFDSEETPLICV
jgi:hypothetical protein